MEGTFNFEEFLAKYPELKELIGTPDVQAKRIEEQRAEAEAEFGELYPGVIYTENFLFDWKRARRVDAVCQTCTGYPCKKHGGTEGFQTKVYYNEFTNAMATRFCKCKYRVQYEAQMRTNRLFKMAAIPAKYFGKTFGDYEVTKDNQAAVRWAHKKAETLDHEGLYFFGNPGTGKTFLSAILAQVFLERGRSVIFSDVPTLLNEIKRTFDKDDADTDKMIERLCKTDVLFLDDIGTENVTEWAVEQLYMIVNNRYIQGLPTFYTSNYKLNDLVERLNAPRSKSKGLTGNRIVSRIFETAVPVELYGQDRRAMGRNRK